MKEKPYLPIVAALSLLLPFCSDDVEDYLNSLSSDNMITKQETLKRIIKEKEADERIVKAVTGLLSSDSKNIRQKAVEALGYLKAEESVPGIIKALNDPDPDVTKEAITALGKIRDRRAVEPLMEILKENEGQLFAIWALGQIGDRKALPLLSKLMESDDPYIKYNATQALRNIK